MRLSDLTFASLRRADVGSRALGGFTCDVALPADDTLVLPVETPLALCRQTHSDNVALVKEDYEYPQDVDALITLRPGLAVGVRTADCVPVLLSAPDVPAVAAVHAGWRGTFAHIVAKTVERLRSLGADPARMHAFIGAAVCSSCYEVSEELGEKFSEAGFAEFVEHEVGEKPHLDLRSINREILLRSGLRPENIVQSQMCTRHSTHDGVYMLPSYRRELDDAGRLITLILMPAQEEDPGGDEGAQTDL